MSIGTHIQSFGGHPATYAEACSSEFNILQSVREALRRALGWDVEDTGFTQKLCSVRFALKSLDRHLGRMIELEERGGYMAIVGESKPHLHDRAMALQSQHDQLRGQLGHIVSSFDTLPDIVALNAKQQEHFTALCQDLDTLLVELDQHEKQETDLLQEVLNCEEGGEG